MSHAINQQVAEMIFESTGLTVEQIRAMDHEDIQSAVEQRIGHPLDYGLEPSRLSSGNMLIDMGRVVTSEEIDRRARRIRT